MKIGNSEAEGIYRALVSVVKSGQDGTPSLGMHRCGMEVLLKSGVAEDIGLSGSGFLYCIIRLKQYHGMPTKHKIHKIK